MGVGLQMAHVRTLLLMRCPSALCLRPQLLLPDRSQSTDSTSHISMPALRVITENQSPLKGWKEQDFGGGGGAGQRPSCPQGRVAGSQGKAFTLAANGAWMPGSLGGELGGHIILGVPSPYAQNPHPIPCFYTRSLAKSALTISVCLEHSFLCKCGP
jgi:hypothetical protein